MPITILYNACILLGLISGTKGTAAGIVPIHMRGVEAFIFAAIMLSMNNITSLTLQALHRSDKLTKI